MIKIAVDAMGADLGSTIVVEAILKFLETHQDAELTVVGKKEELIKLEGKVTIVDARDEIAQSEGALTVIRKKESSMYKAIELVEKGECDAVISAGSTGGFVSCSTLKLKLIEGIERVALAVPFPCKIDKPVLVLDIGANNENTASHLVQFAEMGKIYYQALYQNPNPKIYLLSNGAEESKGSPVVKEAHKLLKEKQLTGFSGNIEGRDALAGEVDVLVCGGVDGNIFLKSTEGAVKLVQSRLKTAFKGSPFSMIGYLLAKRQLKKNFKNLDYKRYGGALVLGLNGVAVKAHGSSDVRAFGFGLDVTYNILKSGAITKIKEGISKNVQ